MHISAKYKSVLCQFMSFHDGENHSAKEDNDFTPKHLLSLTDQDMSGTSILWHTELLIRGRMWKSTIS
jgi:hypothetical protein